MFITRIIITLIVIGLKTTPTRSTPDADTRTLAAYVHRGASVPARVSGALLSTLLSPSGTVDKGLPVDQS